MRFSESLDFFIVQNNMKRQRNTDEHIPDNVIATIARYHPRAAAKIATTSKGWHARFQDDLEGVREHVRRRGRHWRDVASGKRLRFPGIYQPYNKTELYESFAVEVRETWHSIDWLKARFVYAIWETIDYFQRHEHGAFAPHDPELVARIHWDKTQLLKVRDVMNGVRTVDEMISVWRRLLYSVTLSAMTALWSEFEAK
jgi:hypothetical protein